MVTNSLPDGPPGDILTPSGDEYEPHKNSAKSKDDDNEELMDVPFKEEIQPQVKKKAKKLKSNKHCEVVAAYMVLPKDNKDKWKTSTTPQPDVYDLPHCYCKSLSNTSHSPTSKKMKTLKASLCNDCQWDELYIEDLVLMLALSCQSLSTSSSKSYVSKTSSKPTTNLVIIWTKMKSEESVTMKVISLNERV